jgi:uncharacterized repeat protein (TIGR01451 family)
MALGCLAVCAATGACGGSGSPAAPSSTSGASILGLVTAPASSSFALSTPASIFGLVVTIEGTDLSSAVDASGQFSFANVPSGDVRMRFTGGGVNAAALLSDVRADEYIEVRVNVSNQTATLMSEVRTGKVQLCHRTDSGEYHPIEVSVNAESTHRAHGDGKVGERVPGSQTKVFGANCQPAGVGVNIEKLTNGQDADVPPGPSIQVGSQVTWSYVVTNNGNAALSNIVVTDNRPGVIVTCPQSSLAVGAPSMTCSATGVAVLGQYSNIGTVTANSSNGPVTDADPSHYLGVSTEPTTEKVTICHKTGPVGFILIEVSIDAEPAHRAHGDGRIGDIVPADNTKMFGPGCTLVAR